MKPAVKVFATLSLAAAVGEKIKKTGHTKNVRGAGTALEVAGYEAAGKYPSASFSWKKVESIVAAVGSLIAKPMDPQEILSMLMAGLTDIYAKCNPSRHEILDSVIYAAQTCLDFYPDNIDHEAAFDRYAKWCES